MAEELYTLARENFRKGESLQALNTLGEALQLAIQLNTVQPEAKVLELIGDIYVANGAVEEALPYYLRVVYILEYAGDTVSMQEIFLKTGDAYSVAGAHEKAGDYYTRSMDLLDDRDPAGKTDLSRKLGHAALLSNKPEEAQRHYLMFEQMLAEQGRNLAPAHTLLLKAYRQEGDLNACLEYAQKLLDHHRSEENDSSMAILYNNMGHYLTEQERFEEATGHYNLARSGSFMF